MRRRFIAGNWKMHKTPGEAVQLARMLRLRLADVENVDVAVCPTFTALTSTSATLKNSNILVGGQNCHWEESGAFTGEISAEILAASGAGCVILGHSERRQLFGETDETVNLRLGAALRAGLDPIVCVGETLENREANQTFEVVGTQLRGALSGFDATALAKLTVAYEPVWAIGTGLTATPDQAQEVHAHIRSILNEELGSAFSEATRIQYGGSVKPGNAADLLDCPDIDGALVGGAALDAESFSGIVHA